MLSIEVLNQRYAKDKKDTGELLLHPTLAEYFREGFKECRAYVFATYLERKMCTCMIGLVKAREAGKPIDPELKDMVYELLTNIRSINGSRRPDRYRAFEREKVKELIFKYLPKFKQL